MARQKRFFFFFILCVWQICICKYFGFVFCPHIWRLQKRYFTICLKITFVIAANRFEDGARIQNEKQNKLTKFKVNIELIITVL